MAKLKASEMTAEQLEQKHAKAKEKRVERKERYNRAITEIVALLTPEQRKSLSKEAQQLIAVLQQEYKPAQKIEVYDGLSIMQLLSEHPNMSSKKLQKKCDEQGLKIDWAKGCIVKA